MVASNQSTSAQVPGPKGIPLLGNIHQMLSNPLKTLENAFNNHGDLIRLQLGPQNLYVIANPKHMRDILYDNPDSYSKGGLNAVLTMLAGNGLVMLEGDAWRRQRRLLQPTMHRQRLAEMTKVMTDLISDMCDRWEQAALAGKPLNMVEEMTRVARVVIIDTVLGGALSKDDDRVDKTVGTLIKSLGMRFWTYSLPSWLPLPGKKEFDDALVTLNTTIFEIIALAREKGNHDGSDLLSMLLAMRDEDGQPLSDKQIRDEMVSIFIAGYETTAIAMAWTWYFLARHPHYYQRLMDEVDTVLEGRVPVMADMGRLNFPRMVFQESLRLHPSAWFIPRETINETKFGDYVIPPKSPLLICSYLLHHHPEYWEDPMVFNPDRFDPEKNLEATKIAFMPFGAGPRQCMGINFAMLEAQLVISMVAQRFTMELVEDREIKPVIQTTLHPERDILIRLKLRDKKKPQEQLTEQAVS